MGGRGNNSQNCATIQDLDWQTCIFCQGQGQTEMSRLLNR